MGSVQAAAVGSGIKPGERTGEMDFERLWW